MRKVSPILGEAREPGDHSKASYCHDEKLHSLQVIHLGLCIFNFISLLLK